jgi:hypothetical protein
MPSHCLWCKKQAGKVCACCHVAHYCSRECQEKDYPTHKAEGPAGYAMPLGKDGGGAMEVEPAQRGTLPRGPRVAKGSILGLYTEEIDKLVAVRLRRLNLMSDKKNRDAFVEKHPTRETYLMAATRDAADSNPYVRDQLDALFEVEERETEQRMATYHIQERRRFGAYAQKHGLLLNWTEYSNIVRLRELSAYQLTVGAGEDIHGQTTYCEQGLQNGERANRLLTEFLLRPTLNKHDASLYQRYEAALRQKEAQTDHIRQYVEDFFPYYWERLESEVVEMVRVTFEPKEVRESVGKRPASPQEGGGGGKRPRTFGAKGEGGMNVEGEGKPFTGSSYEDLITLLLSEEPVTQTYLDELYRVRKEVLNKKIEAMSAAYEEELEGDELTTFHTTLLEKVQVDARIGMDTLRHSSVATAGLEGEAGASATQDEMLTQWEEAQLEKMAESVKKKDSSLWGRIKDMGNWVWPILKKIAPFIMFGLLMAGTVYFLLQCRGSFTTLVTPDASLKKAKETAADIGKSAEEGERLTWTQFNRLGRRVDQNNVFLDAEARVVDGVALGTHAKEEYLRVNHNPIALSEMRKSYEKIDTIYEEAPFQNPPWYPNPSARNYVKESLGDLDSMEEGFLNSNSTEEEQYQLVRAVQDNWESRTVIVENSPEFRDLQGIIMDQNDRIGRFYETVKQNTEVLAETQETLGDIGVEFVKIRVGAEATVGHIEEAEEIIAEYGEQRPLTKAFIALAERWTGENQQRFLHPGYALQNMQLLSKVDMAIYTAVIGFSTVDIALSGMNNILVKTGTKGYLAGFLAFFTWTTDWGNLGAVRTLLTAAQLVTKVTKAAASIPVRRTLDRLDELVALFQYDVVKPINLEDTWFLEAMLRERPDLPKEDQERFVALREAALLGRTYSADLYGQQFLENAALEGVDDEELAFLQGINQIVASEERYRYLRVIYRRWLGDWSCNTAAVILGHARNVVDFVGDTTEKTLAYIGVTQKLATVGQIFFSSLSVVQIMFSLTNLLRYAVMSCDAVMMSTPGLVVGAVVSSAAVLTGMYYLTLRLYREALAVPEFKQSDKYWFPGVMYLDVVLTHAWRSPSIATTIWRYTPYVVLTLDTVLSIICRARGSYYPNTRREVLDPILSWTPKFIREYATNERRAAFLEQPKAVNEAFIDVDAARAKFHQEQEELIRLTGLRKAAVVGVSEALQPPVPGDLWAEAVIRQYL